MLTEQCDTLPSEGGHRVGTALDNRLGQFEQVRAVADAAVRVDLTGNRAEFVGLIECFAARTEGV
ncbi:MAG: hypothetical protein O3A10_14595 [Chloroflexi bacterium]|nr:hypothetical protein [Chloroflexota bacterium]MDA1147590.1 hypothetical protein [Chloroflexota bacterium]